MAKVKDYILVVDSSRRTPGKTRLDPLPQQQERVTGARAAAKRASELVRKAKLEDVDNRFVNVFDADTRKAVMICQGPTLMSWRTKRPASRSFAQCQITQKAFKTALKVKLKKRR